MNPLDTIVTLAGVYTAAGLSYAAMVGVTAGLRARVGQPDRDATLRDLLARLPAVITAVGPFDDIIDCRTEAHAWRAQPPERKPGNRRGVGR